MLYYVDDLRGQMLPFGEPVEELRRITWICNLFAVPKADVAFRLWTVICSQVQRRLAIRPNYSFAPSRVNRRREAT